MQDLDHQPYEVGRGGVLSQIDYIGFFEASLRGLTRVSWGVLQGP